MTAAYPPRITVATTSVEALFLALARIEAEADAAAQNGPADWLAALYDIRRLAARAQQSPAQPEPVPAGVEGAPIGKRGAR